MESSQMTMEQTSKELKLEEVENLYLLINYNLQKGDVTKVVEIL